MSERSHILVVNSIPISNEIDLTSGVFLCCILLCLHIYIHIYTRAYKNMYPYAYIYICCDMKSKANKVVMKMAPKLAC